MRQPNHKSKTNRLVLTGRDEERERINAFKELCARNNLKVRDVLMEKVDNFLRQHNWPPGNSQTVITSFSKQTNIAKEQVVVQKPRLNNINYSKLSLEELQGLFDKARKLNRMGQMQVIAFELKKRKIVEESA